MCGRFALFVSRETLAEYFDLMGLPGVELGPRYNVAPGQAVAVVRDDRAGGRTVASLRWGLVPFWAKDAAIGHKLVNARLESAAEKPAYREAWLRRRCLIPASGFYEWRGTVRGRRQPFFIAPADEPLLAIAGLWERWRTPAGETLETCVVVTTAANATLAPIHDRMPLLVPRGAEALWLDPRTGSEAAAALAADAPRLSAWPVSTAVNDARRDDATMIAALSDPS